MNKIIWFTGQPGSGKTTLNEALVKKFNKDYPNILTISVDGDDLRDITTNKDYSENGRRLNINIAMNITKFLQSKNYLVIASLVSPYKDLRDSLKKERSVLEVYLFTNEKRGKEDFFVENYESPTENCLKLNTGNKTIEECIDEILSVYW